MKPSNNARMLFFAVVLTVISSMMLNSCGATLREALTMKDQGLKATYPLSYDQTYTAMRTALVWLLAGSRTNIEEHKEQGCLLVGAGGDSRGYWII
jgi:hypothetical protein